MVAMTAQTATIERIGPGDEWPQAVSDGLSLACSDCGQVPRFDYHVSEDFWRRWVPGPDHLGVVCLACLDKRCRGVGLAEALEQVDWTGTGHTIRLAPIRRIDYSSRLTEGANHRDPR
jgi:hypothetical protein